MVENNELSTPESVSTKVIKTPDENIDIEEEIASDDLTIPGDYSDHDILEGGKYI